MLPLRRQKNGQQLYDLLWSPETPRLIDAEVTLSLGTPAASTPTGGFSDTVSSYVGIRSVSVDGGRFLLNDQPYFVRSVLEQGYWPQSHLAAPSPDALRVEVELIKALGFNAVRIHQKVEDPRFLYWADRLGLLVWGEAPATQEFTTEAITRLTVEWLAILRRDRSHPCIVTWVPINESWGIQHIMTDPAQRAFSRGLADLTRAVDPTRPVISNDGWEHTKSDIITIHDYDQDAERLRARYSTSNDVQKLFAGYGPVGRRIMAEGDADPEAPLMVSEFGGISFVTGDVGASWGYATVDSEVGFEQALRAIFTALNQSTEIAGYCYTQLTDTMQEANGLTDEHRVPKLPVSTIRAIVTGDLAQ